MARKANIPRFHSHKISIDTDNYSNLISEQRTRRQSIAETSLSEFSNSFLQETDRISQIDDSLRGDIDRKFRNSTSNTHYVFPRLEAGSHKRTLSQPESMPQPSPLKLVRLHEHSMQRIPTSKQQISTLVKSKSQSIRKLRSHTPQKQRPIMHSHTQSSSTYDLMKIGNLRSASFKTHDLTSTRPQKKHKSNIKPDNLKLRELKHGDQRQDPRHGDSRHGDLRIKSSPYKQASTPAKLRIPEQPRLNLLNKSQARGTRPILARADPRSLLRH